MAVPANDVGRSASFDVAVIGGGINGAGIARELAGRGGRVLLLEAGDLANGTSSASSKLIHGGLRYLEHYEFALVREALSERERLWSIAPHLIWPMRFVLPHVAGLRPRWLLRLGLFLYDHLGGRRRLPGAESVRLSAHPAGGPLKREFAHAFEYSDCWVDDARLVVLNVRDAADRGAEVHTRYAVRGLAREGNAWSIATDRGTFGAAAVVNAAGPAVLEVGAMAGEPAARAVRLVRGSHIVVKSLFAHGFPYFFQLPDGRIFFAIPFERDFTLIGTTDREHRAGDPVLPSADEIEYLCEGASRFFRRPVTPADVVWSYAGIRPLVDDGAARPEAATRGYRLELSREGQGAPILSVFGGKITSYRRLAEEAADLLAARLPALAAPHWTHHEALPGGDFPCGGQRQLAADLLARYPFLLPDWADRMTRAYGTSAERILGGADSLDACGVHFGHGLTEREVRHLQVREWAVTADDILWRRTKLGLRFTPEQRQALEQFMAQEPHP